MTQYERVRRLTVQQIRRVSALFSKRSILITFVTLVIVAGIQFGFSLYVTEQAISQSDLISQKSIAKELAVRLHAGRQLTSKESLLRQIRDLGALNPGIRIYVVDQSGIIRATPESYGPVKLPFVNFKEIKQSLESRGPEQLFTGDDPHDINKQAPVSAATLSVAGMTAYLYVVLAPPTDSTAWMAGLSTTALTTTALVCIVGSLVFGFTNRLYGVQSQLTGISHDLRSPLTAIRGYLETVLEQSDKMDPREAIKCLSIALKSTESAAQLVDDLHHVSKYELNSEVLQKEKLSLAELVMDTTMSLVPALKAKKIELKYEQPRFDTSVRGNIPMLERLLRNIFENSIRYTPENGTITVQLFDVNKKIRVIVSDTGCGVAGHELSKLQDEFFRGSQTKNTTAGSGIGLTIAKRAAALHGTELQIVSREKEGTAVSFELLR